MLASVERGDTVLVPNPSYPIHIYGPVIGGALAQALGLRLTFIVSAGVYLAAFALVVALSAAPVAAAEPPHGFSLFRSGATNRAAADGPRSLVHSVASGLALWSCHGDVEPPASGGPAERMGPSGRLAKP